MNKTAQMTVRTHSELLKRYDEKYQEFNYPTRNEFTEDVMRIVTTLTGKEWWVLKHAMKTIYLDQEKKDDTKTLL